MLFTQFSHFICSPVSVPVCCTEYQILIISLCHMTVLDYQSVQHTQHTYSCSHDNLPLQHLDQGPVDLIKKLPGQVFIYSYVCVYFCVYLCIHMYERQTVRKWERSGKVGSYYDYCLTNNEHS